MTRGVNSKSNWEGEDGEFAVDESNASRHQQPNGGRGGSCQNHGRNGGGGEKPPNGNNPNRGLNQPSASERKGWACLFYKNDPEKWDDCAKLQYGDLRHVW